MAAEEGPVLITLQVLVLIGPQRPDEGDEAAETQPNRDRDQRPKYRHFAFLSRSAFRTTASEDPDIASAAINGVTIPITASGIAIAFVDRSNPETLDCPPPSQRGRS